METSAFEDARFQASGNEQGALLEIQDLKVQFFTPRATIKAVDGVTFSIREREAARSSD
jgi:ABC-type glutathione transport system ATPase component